MKKINHVGNHKVRNKSFMIFITLILCLSILTSCGDITPNFNRASAIQEKMPSSPTQSPVKKPAVIETKKPTAPKEKNNKNMILAKVVRVKDGDTLVVSINGKEETVRMVLIDSPESVKPNTPIQPYALEASAFTKKELEGEEVMLERDVSERDKYKRMLAYVYKGDKMFNELLLEKGLARVAKYPPDVKYVDRFTIIQNIAKKAKLGIWSIEDYATDKGFTNKKAEPVKPKVDLSPSPKSGTAKNSDEVYYPSCSSVKKAGKAPLHKGDAGYNTNLDRDGDGVACE